MEEDEGGGVLFPFSKTKGLILESENRFFLRKKEDDPELLGEEVGCLLFKGTVSFGGGRTKVGGLNMMMSGTFS